MLAGALVGCGGSGEPDAGSPDGNPDAPYPQPPAAQPLQVLVPAYFYPLPGSAWEDLARGAKAWPGVRITAIVNPNNGASGKADPLIAQAIGAFTQAGGQVIGYVPTRYGNGKYSQADIRSQIDRYLAFYGRAQISGFFLDEMAATAPQLAFYRQIHDYIKGLDPRLLIVGNPGTLPVAQYADVADTLVTFEGQAQDYRSFDPAPLHPWVYQYSNTVQAMLTHDAPDCSDMLAALRTATSTRSNTGWVYVTDQHYDYANNIGNPWDALPSYWNALLSNVAAWNQGKALAGC